MASANVRNLKRSFSTRISRTTLEQLDRLVRLGCYGSRTAAIEDAVARLIAGADDGVERRRRAFAATCGALSVEATPDTIADARDEYYEWLAERTRGG